MANETCGDGLANGVNLSQELVAVALDAERLEQPEAVILQWSGRGGSQRQGHFSCRCYTTGPPLAGTLVRTR